MGKQVKLQSLKIRNKNGQYEDIAGLIGGGGVSPEDMTQVITDDNKGATDSFPSNNAITSWTDQQTDTLISVQGAVPTAENNKIWVDTSETQEIQIPDMEDLDAKENINNKTNIISDANKANTTQYTSVKAVADFVEPVKTDVTEVKSAIVELRSVVDSITESTESANIFNFHAVKQRTAISNSGVESTNNAYFISEHIPVEPLSYFSYDQKFYKAVMLDADGTAIGNVSDATDTTGFIRLENARFVVLQYAYSTVPESDIPSIMVNYGDVLLPFEPYGGGGIAVKGLQNIRDDVDVIDARVSAIEDGIQSEYIYFGDKIKFDNRLNYEYIGTTNSAQGGAIYDGVLFAFNKNGTFNAMDLTTKTVKTGTMEAVNGVYPHCNAVFFGQQKYASSDKYPIIYVNAYNNAGFDKGVLIGYRITDNGSTYSAEVVHTIRIGFVAESMWTDGASDTRPYGNFVLDTDTNELIVYTLLDTTNVTRFFRFAMPNHTAGNVVLNISDIIEYWDCDYYPYIQDSAYNSGKVYITSGNPDYGTPYIHVVDTVSKRECSRIDMASIGMNYEPEIIDIYDRTMYAGAMRVYKFTF